MIVEDYLLRQSFRREIARPDADLNLALCALLIAAEEYPGLALDDYLWQLDELAGEVRGRLDDDRVPVVLAALNRYLFDDLGFVGNANDYYDPANSYLNEVLDRRTGVPITLSLVYLEVGWRLGLPLAGVGLPGHFIVSCRGPEGVVYIDPFHGGTLLDERGCMELMQRAVGDRLRFRREFLLPVSKRQILSRLLGNLKVVYQQQQDAERTLAVLDRMLELDPDSPAELRDRGKLYARFRALALAQVDFRKMLMQQAHGADADEAREQLRRLERLWVN